MITKLPPDVLDFFVQNGNGIVHKGKTYLNFDYVMEVIDFEDDLVDLIPSRFFPEELRNVFIINTNHDDTGRSQ